MSNLFCYNVQSMKVLIIDGDSFVRAVYESELRQENIEVISAGDGREGLEKIREQKPDLIIIELILTKLNGFELIKEIKKDEELKKIPIVVASELNQKQDVREVLAMGVNIYLQKDSVSSKQVVYVVLNLLMNLL